MYYSNSDIRVEDISMPEIGDGEILMRVVSSGVCGSDLMEWYRLPKAPLVLGHEVSGEVVETGKGVKEFKKGDRIVTTHHVPCNSCFYCLSDRHTVCPSIKSTFFDPGGFSEYLRIPAVNVERGTFLLDESVTFDEGSFAEPLGCVVRGQRVAGFEPGMSVAVIGSGITGILNLQYAIAQGSSYTCAVDISKYKLDSALKFGADDAFLSDDPQLIEKILNRNGRLIDFVIVCAGVDPAIKQALKLVEKGGTVLYFAPSEPEYEFKTNFNELWWSGVKIISSYAAAPADLQMALDLITYKRVNVADMVTHNLPLAEIEKGFQMVGGATDSLKIIINPGN